MAFILTSEGATVFSLSAQSTQQTDILDPSLIFNADFFGAKCNRFVQNVVRTNGQTFSNTPGRYVSQFTVYFGKTYDKPPPVFGAYVNNYEITYNTNLFPQQIVSEDYYMGRWTSASNLISWGWRATVYPDRAAITTYELDGNFILYVLDI